MPQISRNISPTPWKICHDANGDLFIAAADGTTVAEIGCPDDGAAEDAQFLVAAVNAAELHGLREQCRQGRENYARVEAALNTVTAERDALLAEREQWMKQEPVNADLTQIKDTTIVDSLAEMYPAMAPHK